MLYKSGQKEYFSPFDRFFELETEELFDRLQVAC